MKHASFANKKTTRPSREWQGRASRQFVRRRLLAFAEQAQEPQEHVHEVQEDLQGDEDRVRGGRRAAGGLVEVEDDDAAEQRHRTPVQPGHRGRGLGAEVAGDRHDEVADDRDPQRAEQPGAPAREALRVEEAERAEADDHRGRDGQDLHDADGRVVREDRAGERAHGQCDERVAEDGHLDVLLLDRAGRDDDADDLDHEGADEHGPTDRVVDGHPGHEARAAKTDHGPGRDHGVVGREADGFGVGDRRNASGLCGVAHGMLLVRG